MRAGRLAEAEEQSRLSLAAALRQEASEDSPPVVVARYFLAELIVEARPQEALDVVTPSLAARPKLLCLDEPAAGLSRAERQLLTALLLSLDRAVTLLIIEHDMDVALTVAEQVTVMHDGSVVAEGTPDEIRSNSLVHDLYLGRAHA